MIGFILKLARNINDVVARKLSVNYTNGKKNLVSSSYEISVYSGERKIALNVTVSESYCFYSIADIDELDEDFGYGTLPTSNSTDSKDSG